MSQSNVGAGDWLQARGGGGCVLAPNLLVCSVTQSQAARGTHDADTPLQPLHDHTCTQGEIHVGFSEFIRYVMYIFPSFPHGVCVCPRAVRTCLRMCGVTSVCTAVGSSALRWRVGTKHHKYSRY